MTKPMSRWSDDELQARLDALHAERTRKYQQVAYSLDSPQREQIRQDVENIERHMREINEEVLRRRKLS